MNTMFSATFFAGNRLRLRNLFTGTAPIVITANGLLQKAGDSTYPFTQDPNFWYLTGISDPDFILVLDRDKEYLIAPELSSYQQAFDGSVSVEQLISDSDITMVLPEKEGWKQLTSRIKKVRHVATLAANPPYIPDYGMYTNPARATLIQKLKDINPEVELLDLRQHLAQLRMVKQPLELTAIQTAIDLTVDCMRKVKTKLPKFAYEYEIEADIAGYFLKHGADNAWKPIVASGPRACVLHARDNRAACSSDELVVIDIGAEADHYCADITRTYALGGKPTKRQRQIYDAVLEVQAFAFELQKPGTLIRENEQKVEQFIGEKLRELGLVKSIEHDKVRHYYPHSTSHFLGIEPHDTGDYDRPLESGVVLTVEPGIYIPEEGIGIRIEDDVLITDSGYEILSKRLPREL